MSPLSLSTLQSLIDSFDGDKSLLSDGFHSFSELYESRLLLQASLFNEWSRQSLYQVHKSKFHSDGLPCFDGNWFIVMAILPTGQISNLLSIAYNQFILLPLLTYV